jgi:purine-binding chemotaxis protein CheW
MKDEEASRKGPRTIDWEEVNRRLTAARTTIEKGWMPTPEEKRNILRNRAKTLAHETAKDDSSEKIEVLEFLLAYERYGIESSFVREVYPLKDLTPVPCTPMHVLGIINVRGQILSVIDLKKFFDLPEKGLGDLNKVIILKGDAMEFGVLADVILGVSTLPLSTLQQALPTLTGIREEYLKGISEDRTTILDGAKILSDAKIVVNEEVNV